MSRTYLELANGIASGVLKESQRTGEAPLEIIDRRIASAKDPLLAKILGLALSLIPEPTPAARESAPVECEYLGKSALRSARVFQAEMDRLEYQQRCGLDENGVPFPLETGVSPVSGLFQAPRGEKVSMKLQPRRLPMRSLMSSDAARHLRRNRVLISQVYEEAPPTHKADRERSEARVTRHVGSRIVHPRHNTKQRFALS